MKVSIITPCLNARSWIKDCVESVALQNIDQLEHIVIDGGSLDGTLEELAMLSERFSNLKWITRSDDGQADAMNVGFMMATGIYIGYLNADDFLAPQALRLVLNCFEEDHAIDMIVGNLIILEEKSQRLMKSSIKMQDLLIWNSFKWPLNPACYFFKRSVQQSVGLYPTGEHYVMDYWFLLRAFQVSRRKKIESVIGYFRIHGENKSRTRDIRKRLQSCRNDFILKDASAKYKFFALFLLATSVIRKLVARFIGKFNAIGL